MNILVFSFLGGHWGKVDMRLVNRRRDDLTQAGLLWCTRWCWSEGWDCVLPFLLLFFIEPSCFNIHTHAGNTSNFSLSAPRSFFLGKTVILSQLDKWKRNSFFWSMQDYRKITMFLGVVVNCLSSVTNLFCLTQLSNAFWAFLQVILVYWLSVCVNIAKFL